MIEGFEGFAVAGEVVARLAIALAQLVEGNINALLWLAVTAIAGTVIAVRWANRRTDEEVADLFKRSMKSRRMILAVAGLAIDSAAHVSALAVAMLALCALSLAQVSFTMWLASGRADKSAC